MSFIRSSKMRLCLICIIIISLGSFSTSVTTRVDATSPLGNPPYVPNNPLPRHGEIDIRSDTFLQWNGGDPDSNDVVLYNVYLGTNQHMLDVIALTAPYPASEINITFDIHFQLQINTKYYWKIIAYDSEELSSESPVWSFTTTTNNAPNIPLTPSGPSSGSQCIELMYHTVSQDIDNDNLTYAWDWDDGTPVEYTNNYSSDEPCSITHTFQQPGLYNISVQAYDEHGKNSSWSQQKKVNVTNKPPFKNFFPNPVNNAHNVSIYPVLSWHGGDSSACDLITYTLYFGETENPPLLDTIGPYPATTPTINYSTSQLQYHNTYYWQIHAKDQYHAETVSPLYTFTTVANQPPVTPYNLLPVNNSKNLALPITLSWNCSDPENHMLTYDVYCGSTNPPALAANNIQQQRFTPDIEFNTTYYWQIHAYDGFDGYATSPLYQFTSRINTAPETPVLSGPIYGDTSEEITYTLSNTNDPENDHVYVFCNWGDGTTSGWLGPYDAGQTIPLTHIWNKEGIYEITVQLKDAFGYISNWSTPYSFTVDGTPPLIEIIKPQEGIIYLFDDPIIQRVFPMPIAIGDLEIQATAVDELTNITTVELYIDGKLTAEFTAAPYKWLWYDPSFALHVIQIIAYDSAGNYDTADVTVLKIF